ncbi:hypothetical protein BUALT_Bualt19G0052600 [Buddleja alternifolia]|uniref:TTF-type domain-containing protein n=1 Tax=Buddleja alternifolia TaxID=168488 RepID=A0AAV6W2B5_9LAMI|nr:hypothetical protein BUALT_Bualt19G0052600 [Buddleja alternifolia]
MPDTSASMPEFHRPGKVSRVEKEEIDLFSLERDPGLRRPISEYPIEQRDKVRRAYIMAGPYQPRLGNYPLFGVANHLRSFQESWYGKFSSWLEYSTDKDAAYCLPCYVFSNILSNRFGMNAFTEIGFRNWKKINDGNKCAFLKHIGTSPSSPHNQCVRACDDLMAQSHHIDKILHMQSAKMIVENRLRLKTSIDAIRWLTFQACALRGNDESIDSLNRGNFIELIKLLGSYNSSIGNIVLDKAPVSTTKTLIQKKREIGWETFIHGVKSFCEEHVIDIPDMTSPYVLGRVRGRHAKEPISMEHHYQVNLFIATIDTQ